VAEGDTIHRHALGIAAALGEEPIREATAPAPKSPLRLQGERLAALEGRRLASAEARGKHLLLHFEGGLVLHSHLGIRGSWQVRRRDQRWRRPVRTAWAVLSTTNVDVAQFGGSRVAMRTEAELRTDPRLTSLGPDVLDPSFDSGTGVRALRRIDPGRELGEALLDQSVLAGVGNLYKSEGCFAARIDPRSRVGELSEQELSRVVVETASLMRAGLETGERPRDVYRRAGQRCLRCGERIHSQGQGDANRVAYWCPGCQR
jgi:endonuclease VIII